MRFLVIKVHYIGDVVMITPALRRLKRAFPDAQVDILIGSWSGQVVYHNPNISRIFSVDDRIFSWKNPWNLFRVARLFLKFRVEHYDGVLMFHARKRVRLFGFGLSAPVAFSYHPSRNDSHRYSLWDPRKHGVRIAVDLVDAFCRGCGVEPPSRDEDRDYRAEWFVTEEESAKADEVLASVGVHEPPIVVHPNAGVPGRVKGGEKRWLPERFADLIQELRHQQLGPVLLEGAGFEEPLAQEIQALLPEPVGSIVGMTNLRELAAVLSKSRLLITNDTGTMHVGGAVGVPMVAIFGPTPSDKFLPLGGPFRAVQSRVPCSPCNYGGFKGCLYNEIECMKEISVSRVMDEVLHLIG
jgi:lipopolysaccharide heptosyltransferase II